MANASFETTQSSHSPNLDALDQTKSRQRVLIIDDEEETVNLIKTVLMMAGMDVVCAESGEIALAKVDLTEPDVILLDLMMPQMDGWETFVHLKRITPAPIIFLTARDIKEDVVRFLRLGVDDYISKPFHPAELVYRILTLIVRNSPKTPDAVFYFPEIDLKINLETREISIRGISRFVPPKAMRILTVLARNPSRWVSNQTIAAEVWGDDSPKTVRRIKNLIYLLRRMLEDDRLHPRLILSRESLDYRLEVVPPEKK
ncbi:MAG: response regulator transcription factor [Anaerolineaceae bacterium]